MSSLTEILIFGYNIQETTSTNNYPQHSVKLAQTKTLHFFQPLTCQRRL